MPTQRNFNVTAYLCLEYEKAGVWVEEEFEVSGYVSPYDPGVCWGPPDACYPPEGGDVEDVADTVTYRPVDVNGKLVDKTTEMPYGTFREIMIIAHTLISDKRDSAEDKADALIVDALLETAMNAPDDDYDGWN